MTERHEMTTPPEPWRHATVALIVDGEPQLAHATTVRGLLHGHAGRELADQNHIVDVRRAAEHCLLLQGWGSAGYVERTRPKTPYRFFGEGCACPTIRSSLAGSLRVAGPLRGGERRSRPAGAGMLATCRAGSWD